MMTQKSTTRIIRAYGKKPRGSKTSFRFFYKGFNFFAHSSKAETGGAINLYWDKTPYPHIVTLTVNDEVPLKICEKWIEKELDWLLSTLSSMKQYALVPKEFLKTKINTSNYDISLTHKKFYSMTYVELESNHYLYLYCNLLEAPTKVTDKNKRVLDTKKIYAEYLKRKQKE